MSHTLWVALEKTARTLHANGAAVHHIETALVDLGRQHGARVEVLATPTGVTAGLGEVTRIWRVEPPGLDLGALAATWRIVHRATRGEIGLEEAIERLDAVRTTHPRSPIVVVASGIVGAAAVVLLGGRAIDVGAALVVSVATWLIAQRAARSERAGPLAQVIAGLVAGLGAAGFAYLGARPSIVSLAALFPFLPGLSLVAAMSEVAAGSWNAGNMRFMGTLATLVRLASGLTVGAWLISAPTVSGPGLPIAATMLAAAMLPLGSLMQLGASRRDIPIGVFTGVVSTGIGVGLGGAQGPFLAALWTGLVARVWSARTHRANDAVTVAGILPLVPGSVSLDGAMAVFAGDPGAVGAVAVRAAGIAVAMAGGLLVASALLPSDASRRRRGHPAYTSGT